MSDPKPIVAIVRGRMHGLAVSVEFEAQAAQLPASVRRLVELGLVPDESPLNGHTHAPATRPAADEAAPTAHTHPMASDGRTPLCVYHNATMTEGRHGWYCQRKGTSPETSSPKGFCVYGVRYDRVPRASA